jgi:large subunit ribosomal protein L21
MSARASAGNGSSFPSTFERYAVIQTGGKQYQAIEGKTLAIEKLDAEVGAEVTFTEVLLRKTGDGALEIGAPYVATPVKALIVKHTRGPKLIVFKFKRRKKVRRKQGHRQACTVIRIQSV